MFFLLNHVNKEKKKSTQLICRAFVHQQQVQGQVRSNIQGELQINIFEYLKTTKLGEIIFFRWPKLRTFGLKWYIAVKSLKEYQQIGVRHGFFGETMKNVQRVRSDSHPANPISDVVKE